MKNEANSNPTQKEIKVFNTDNDDQIAALKVNEVAMLLDGMTFNQMVLTLEKTKKYIEQNISIRFEYL
jgi:hypothetical protein